MRGVVEVSRLPLKLAGHDEERLLFQLAVESARDLVNYMVRRGQMTQEEADKLIREAEEASSKRAKAPKVEVARKPAPEPKPKAKAPAPAKKAAVKKPAPKKPAKK